MGGASSPLLPGEIMINIFAEVGSTRYGLETDLRPGHPSVEQITLKNLCLASRVFGRYAQPILFEYVDLFGERSYCLFRGRKLLQMITAREETAGWIKALRLHKAEYHSTGGQPEDPEAIDEESQLADVLSQLFLRLTNLQTLLADLVTVTPEMYACIRLHTLRTLRVRKVTLLDVPVDIAGDDFKIEELTIDSTPDGLGLEIPKAIARFAWGPRLRKLKLGYITPAAVDTLLGNPPRTLDNIEELSFAAAARGVPATQLFQLAAACPKVTSITTRGGHPQDELPVPSPQSNLAPLLSKFQGPIGVAAALVPGRPVKEVAVRIALAPGLDFEWPRENLIPLTMGSVALQTLELDTLPWKDEAMDTIFELFPLVQTLKLSFRGPTQVSILGEMHSHKSVR